MINIKELRIGNYVLVQDGIRQVSLIRTDVNKVPAIGYESNHEQKFIACDSESVKAVPLNDQLLREIGFVFHDHFKVWQFTQPRKNFTIELDRDYTAMDFSHRPILKNMSSLHDLQNLFYTIRGEELLLKEQQPA